MKINIKNQWALVTGASTGIGLEIARQLAEKGYHLILVARSEDKLKNLANELQNNEASKEIQIQIFPADLSIPNAAEKLVQKLNAADLSPTLLINNAGFGFHGNYLSLDLAEELEMINLNVIALSSLTKILLPAMLQNKQGYILNVASTAAFQPGPYMATYFATKAFVLPYSEALSEELKKTGVSVSTLCPGPTLSEFGKRARTADSDLFKNKKLPSSKEVAAYGIDAMLKRKRIAIHGAVNWSLVQLLRVLPRRLVTFILAKKLSLDPI
jgi:short-subunit dehydrogenase